MALFTVTNGLCVLGGALAVAGDVFFKRWADRPAHPLWALDVGIAFYCLDACVWALILRRGTKLAMGTVLWSATGLLMATAAGVVLYDEHPIPRQWVGALFVLVGMLLANGEH